MRILADGFCRNSAWVIDRAGQIAGIYDKYHLTISEIEDSGARCGSQTPLIECDFGTIV